MQTQFNENGAVQSLYRNGSAEDRARIRQAQRFARSAKKKSAFWKRFKETHTKGDKENA